MYKHEDKGATGIMRPLSDINGHNFSLEGLWWSLARNKLLLHIIDICSWHRLPLTMQSHKKKSPWPCMVTFQNKELLKYVWMFRVSCSLPPCARVLWLKNPCEFPGKTWLPKHCITHPEEPQPQYPFCNPLPWESQWECACVCVRKGVRKSAPKQ